ncbi:hypothetical protein GCM10023238_36610 [Streptomyces heliomycini]
MAGSNGQAGYTTPPWSSTPRRRRTDWKELFHWGAPLPRAAPSRLRLRYPAATRPGTSPTTWCPAIGSARRELHARMVRFQHGRRPHPRRALGAHTDYFTDMLEAAPVVNRAT